MLDKDLIVFPNPASGGLLQVHYNGDEPIEEVSVYDMTGKLMSHLTVESRRVAVDISSYEPVVYVLQALTDSGLINRKFEVLH